MEGGVAQEAGRGARLAGERQHLRRYGEGRERDHGEAADGETHEPEETLHLAAGVRFARKRCTRADLRSTRRSRAIREVLGPFSCHPRLAPGGMAKPSLLARLAVSPGRMWGEVVTIEPMEDGCGRPVKGTPARGEWATGCDMLSPDDGRSRITRDVCPLLTNKRFLLLPIHAETVPHSFTTRLPLAFVDRISVDRNRPDYPEIVTGFVVGGRGERTGGGVRLERG
jgi:hypothetical protein